MCIRFHSQESLLATGERKVKEKVAHHALVMWYIMAEKPCFADLYKPSVNCLFLLFLLIE
jgi:hypothetical protein